MIRYKSGGTASSYRSEVQIGLSYATLSSHHIYALRTYFTELESTGDIEIQLAWLSNVYPGS